MKAGPYEILGTNQINVILGKNGSGKSTILRALEDSLRKAKQRVLYITPERGGILQYDPNIDRNMSSDPGWIFNSRRNNRFDQFRQQTISQYRKLEIQILREIETISAKRQDASYTFQKYIDKINTLLENICIVREDTDFKIKSKSGSQEISQSSISSGESELISLAIEALAFALTPPTGDSFFLLDEPDVHLHPDLQVKFAGFLEEELLPKGIKIIIATHSVSLIAGFKDQTKVSACFQKNGDRQIEFKNITQNVNRVVPILGAHPLSNLFNDHPLILVEGEDDVRIWQQAYRTSKGRIKIFPCDVDGLPHFHQFETEVAEILNCIYDKPKAFSIRDKDVNPTEIGDIGPIKRFRLKCRAAENLILSNEVLLSIGINPNDIPLVISNWLSSHSGHPHYSEMKNLQASFSRKDSDLKVVRNDFMGLFGCSKPWEVLVGQTIGQMKTKPTTFPSDSLFEYLGDDILSAILKI